MAIVLDGTTGITTPDLTDTSLTSGRVVYAGTGGNLTGSTALTFDGAILGVNGISVGRGAGAVSTNTAVGASALAVTTGSSSGNTGVGAAALAALTSGTLNTALGWNAMALATTATNNVALGENTLFYNNGSANTAVGFQALQGTGGNTYSNNTAVGYQSGYNVTSGTTNTFIGRVSGYSTQTGDNNVTLGEASGYSANGASGNTFLGQQSGYYVTSGAKNTIVGRYTGNQGGLDIRTASNKVVLSDGDGNPVFTYGTYPNGAGSFALSGGYATLGLGGTGSTGTGALFLNGEAASGFGPVLVGYANGASQWQAGSNSWIKGGTTYSTYTVMAGSGGVNLSAGATSWASASDERLKNIIEPITDAATKVSTLRAVIGKYKTDAEGTRRPFLIAQDVQAVLPEAVTEGRNSKEDETEYLQVAYTEVIPLLVAAIKELKAEFDAYKASHP